jgi:ankyrin repeat protein
MHAGADVNVRNGEYDPTAIFKACDLPENLVGKAISMLAKAGADLSIRDNLGRTALEQARQIGDTEAAALLEAEETAQNSRDRN